MLKKSSNLQRGLTITELVVSITITAIILSLVTGIFVILFRSFRSESIKNKLRIDSRTVVDRMADDIRSATAITDTIVDPQTAEQYYSGSGTLILKVLAIDGSNNILYDRYDYIIYKFDTTNNQIIKRTIPHADSARNLETKILLPGELESSSSFTYSPENPPSLNITTVTVNLILSQIANNQTYSYSTTQTIKLRNK
jgi:hypothetical protein